MLFMCMYETQNKIISTGHHTKTVGNVEPKYTMQLKLK